MLIAGHVPVSTPARNCVHSHWVVAAFLLRCPSSARGKHPCRGLLRLRQSNPEYHRPMAHFCFDDRELSPNDSRRTADCLARAAAGRASLPGGMRPEERK